jgi:hypothetical protein
MKNTWFIRNCGNIEKKELQGFKKPYFFISGTLLSESRLKNCEK